ncbi:hypothetical protein FRC17_008081 [Serendipita sp. 399]|nr:hypothetical protein FRC17_008081 [Serendipita sp. 399]
MAMQPFLVNEKETEYMEKPGTWFNGVTPNLRELDLAYIHAPWNDPIYSNLTRLRICLPDTRLKVSQLLRILRQCPSMEYLDLTECFSAPPRPGTSSLALPPHPQVVQQQHIQALGVQGQALETIDDDIGKGLHRVDLPKLWYLQLQESVSASSSYILSYIICPRLETLALCAMGPSSIAANIRVLDESDGDGHIACRPHNQAFESISHLISNTTQLQFLHSNQNQASIIGRIGDDGVPHLARWAHQGDTIKKVPGKGWSFSYASAPYQGNPQLATVPLSHSDRFRAALNHQVELLQQLDLAGVCYHLIEKIDLGGPALYIDAFYENLFSQCFNLKRLRLRTVPLTLTSPSPPPNFLPQAPLDIRPPPYKEAMSILDKVIADRLCPQLEEVHVSWFAASAEELADWVELRASRVKRLKKVVVEVYEPVTQVFQPGLDDMGEESSKLDDQSKMRIEAALEQTDHDSEPRFVWGNPERERMREVHEYYKETYGFKDRDEETDAEMQS